MKLGRTVVLGALGLTTGCFEDPLPPIDTTSTGASESGETGATMTPPTTDPDSTAGPEPSTGSTSTTTTITTGPDDTTGEPPLQCADEVLDPPLGSGLVEASTAPGGDDFTGSCGGAGSPDLAYQWDAPYDGFFVLDTQGSSFDTVLYLYDGCDGPEIVCSDDVTGSVSSRVIGPFAEGERVLVVVDGKAGESGDAVLNINPVECPSADLTGQVLPAGFSNVAGTNEHGGACGGDGNPERAFRWQADADGLYAFSVDSGAFQPAIYLETGPICGGPELACNGPAFGHAEVMRVLSAGDYVTIWADSTAGAGDFDIDITSVGATCPELPLDFAGYAGDIGDFGNVMSSSCGASGYMEGAVFYPYADATFAWTSPGMVGSNSGCDITVTAGFPVALSLQEGSCDGPEAQCATGMFDMMTGQYTATVSVGHIPPTDFTVVVSPAAEPFVWIGGAGFEVQVACYAVG